MKSPLKLKENSCTDRTDSESKLTLILKNMLVRVVVTIMIITLEKKLFTEISLADVGSAGSSYNELRILTDLLQTQS